MPVLGIDCGLGSTTATPGVPPQPALVGDGVLETGCSWIGDVDASPTGTPDSINDPLVSDGPSSFSGMGGGFSAEIRLQYTPPLQTEDTLNGFDVTVSWDPKYLHGVKLEQSGLQFDGSFSLVAAIDNGAGEARLTQVLLGGTAVPDSNNGITLFRIRFDVVGVGTTGLVISADKLTNPNDVVHKTQDGSLESVSVFDASATLGWDVSWTFSPNPEVPGSSTTFDAAASCPGCGTLSFDWDWTSDGAGDASGDPLTLTAPSPNVHRVALTVSDGTNIAVAVRRLPLNVAVAGPATGSVAGSLSYSGMWLGGVPNYSGSWRLCPSTTPANQVCSNTAPNVVSMPDQTNPQTVIYRFAGTYTNTLRIQESTPQWISSTANSVTATFIVSIDGSPSAYTVTVTTNVTQAAPGDPVGIQAVMKYSGDTALILDLNSNNAFDTGETVLSGAAVTGATLTDDALIKYRDSNNNISRDGTECTFYDAANNDLFDAANDVVLAGTCPGTGTTTIRDDARIKFVDMNGNLSYDAGTPAAPASYPGAARSSFFDVFVQFGDALSATVSGGRSNCAISQTLICTANATHVYNSLGTFTITATATESAPTASSKITEIGAGTITVSPGVEPLAGDFSFNPASPLVGQSVEFTATATGGTTPYTFSWDFGDGTPAGSGSPVSHTYATKGSKIVILTITDSGDPVQTVTVSKTVTVDAQPLTVDFSFTPATVGKPVIFTASASGGTLPYSFTWTFGADGSGIGNPATHTFSVKGSHLVDLIVTDANGDSAGQSHLVTVAGQPLFVDLSFSPTSPNAGEPVTFTGLAEGGTSPYAFSWDFGDGTPAATGNPVSHTYLSPGTFNIILTVTDANDASQTASQPVDVAPQPPGELLVTVVCPDSGLTAGKPFQCDVSATGGTPPYAGTGPQQVVFPVKGTQVVSFTVTDSSQPPKTATGSDIVDIADQPLIVTVVCPDTGLTSDKPFMCDVSAAGGTAPYAGTGSRVATIVAKGVQEVTFTVTDSNGIIAAGIDTVNIAAQPLTVDFSFSPTDPVAGQPVTLIANAAGGTIPYMFNWDFGDGGTADIQTAIHTFAATGDYTVTVRVTDANTVTATISHIITVSPAPGFQASFTFTPANPTVGKPVSFTSSVSGGAPPFSYRWNFGDFSITDVPNPDHVYAAKGTYTAILIVTDNNNVDATAQMTIAVQAQPLVVTVVCPETVLTAGKPFECTVLATGGTLPYVGTGQRTAIFPVKGTHTVAFEVTDDNSVTAAGSATVTIAPQPLTVDFTFTPTTVTTGKPVTFTATVSGGTSPYTFSWDFGDGTPLGTGNPVSHAYLIPGSFIVILTVGDANDASQAASQTVDVAPQPPGELLVIVVCPDSGLTAGKPFQCDVSATGGTPPYTGTGPQQVSFPVKGTQIVSFTVTDSNEVSATGSDTVIVSAQPLSLDFTHSPAIVTTGKPVTFTATASAGTGPYMFDWDFGDGTSGTEIEASHTYAVKGQYTVTLLVTDSNQATMQMVQTVVVNGQPLQVTINFRPPVTTGKLVTFVATVSGGTEPYSAAWDFGDGSTALGFLPAHAYAVKGPYNVMVTITDANEETASATIPVTVQPQPLIADFSAVPKATVGDPVTFTATVSGGTSPYEFSWSFGDDATGTGSPVDHAYASTGTFQVLLTVTDANAASTTASHEIMINEAGQALAGDFTFTPATAGKPASFTASATGGVPPYMFDWDFGDGSSGSGASLSHSYSVKGSYAVTLTITDSAIDSTFQVSHAVPVDPQPLVVSFTIDRSPVTTGKAVGFIWQLQGGTSPYRVQLDFGDDIVTDGLPPGHVYSLKGTYHVSLTVTDANDESTAYTSAVNVEPQPLVVSVECPVGLTAGEQFSCSVQAQGGTAPYTGTGLRDVSFPVKGTYTVSFTATDANGETATGSTSVTIAPQPLTAEITIGPLPATVGQPVTFSATVTGGTAPYVFNWSFGDETSGSGNPASHAYSSPVNVTVQLIVTDANGATAIIGHDLSILPVPSAAVLLTFDGCDVDSFVNGVGELRVFINGDFVIDIPAGLHNLTGTGEYAPYDDVCVSFGPFDITSSVQQGVNTLVFQNPLIDHFSKITNIRVVQGDLVFLFDTRVRNSSPGTSEVLTFSVPPLVLTGFAVVQPAVFTTEQVTFTASFTGGTGPFRCTFTFGDGDGKSMTTNEHSCSASHTYWSARLRTASLRVKGATTGDDVRGTLLVKVEPQPGYSGDGLLWRDEIAPGENQVFTTHLTNPSSVTVLVRLDLTVTRPNGSKELFISPSFMLSPGETRTGLTFNYSPVGGEGDYCFKAPVKYGVDTNGNGVLEDSEILGARSAKSGCFEVELEDADLFAAVSPFLFFGTALIPKGRNSLARYMRSKNTK